MSDQSTGVGAGTLSGVNLTGDENGAAEAALPVEDDRTIAEAAAEAPTTPSDEPPAPAPPAPDEPADEPDPPAQETTAKKGAPARQYVVLKEDSFEDSADPYYTKVHEVEARNAQNAMRQAFKDLSSSGDTAEAVLVVIPKSMFRPTPVRLNKTERVSVSFG